MLTKSQNYSDLPFFIAPNPFTRDINKVNGLSAIRQSIKNIVLTNNGERPFEFSFGSSLYGILFDNFTYELMMDIQSRIANNIRIYEPRVGLSDVRVLDNPSENAVSIIIDFYIPDLNQNDIIQINLARTR
jgi:phage baseplate assembly protein W